MSVLPRALSSTLDQLRRDLAVVRGRFEGRHPSPVVWSSASSRARPTPPRAQARELVVTRTVHEARDVATLVLEDAHGAPFDFEPGQFFTVLASIDGETVPRNYSASNAPGTSELHLTIKRKEGGRASGILVAQGRGAHVRVLGPFGSFTLAPRTSGTLVLVAGGVGITPLLSIARAVLASSDGRRVILVYGNRAQEDVAFADALEALAAAHGDRFTLRHVLETPPADWRGEVGRLDRTTFARVMGELGVTGATFYVCGPDGMKDEVLAALGAAGEHDVKTERFTIGGRARDVRTASPVTIRVGGAEHRALPRAGETLLEAGLAAGAPMASSCALGGCGACRVKLVSGEVEMEEPNCLSEAERRAGYVLACVGRAKSPCVLEVEETAKTGKIHEAVG